MKKIKRYETSQQAISALHTKGFIHDFRFEGKSIVWVQEKLSIGEGHYTVLERYDFSTGSNADPLSILAIAAFDQTVKGILIDHTGKRDFITKRSSRKEGKSLRN
jgi:hypothetical protein